MCGKRRRRSTIIGQWQDSRVSCSWHPASVLHGALRLQRQTFLSIFGRKVRNSRLASTLLTRVSPPGTHVTAELPAATSHFLKNTRDQFGSREPCESDKCYRPGDWRRLWEQALTQRVDRDYIECDE